MNNIPNFRNQTIRNLSSKKFNLNSPKYNIKSRQKLFLASSLKQKKKTNKREKSLNERYKNYDMNSNISINEKNNNFNFLTPRTTKNKISNSIIKESNQASNTKIDNNEKCFILNNNLLEYNYIISLLGKILFKTNSYNILSKIKNYIKQLISDNSNTNITLNHSYYKEILFKNESRPLSNNNKSNNNNNISEFKENNNKEELNNKNIYKTINENNNNDIKIENNYLYRKIKKLYHRINELEEKCRIEQLKYLFFIIEQEKKILELEKNFDKSDIPLDERIIEKMKELKCLPNYYKPEINEEQKNANKKNKKKPPLSSKIRTINKNNSFLKSRNEFNNYIKNKYSFDKDIEPFMKKNQSQILNIKINENSKNEYNNNNSKNKSKNKNINFNESYDNNEIRKQNLNNYSKSVHQLFKEKNFFISHPKLKYVKNSQEKNHFQKLKTKEQLNGISNLLSNINLGSKFQKSAINDFSYFINNSMVNLEKLKEVHNYSNIEHKFEETHKLNRKASK